MKTNTCILLGLIAGALLGSINPTAAQIKRYSARISVSGELEKERDSSKQKGKKSVSTKKSEIQYYELEISVANTGKIEETYNLEWFFFKRSVGGNGDAQLAEKGKKSFTIAGMKRIKHPITSKKISWNETKSSNKKNNKKKTAGEEYYGYLVVLRSTNGGIISAEASNRKLESEKWLGKLGLPMI